MQLRRLLLGYSKKLV